MLFCGKAEIEIHRAPEKQETLLGILGAKLRPPLTPLKPLDPILRGVKNTTEIQVVLSYAVISKEPIFKTKIL